MKKREKLVSKSKGRIAPYLNPHQQNNTVYEREEEEKKVLRQVDLPRQSMVLQPVIKHRFHHKRSDSDLRFEQILDENDRDIQKQAEINQLPSDLLRDVRNQSQPQLDYDEWDALDQ